MTQNEPKTHQLSDPIAEKHDQGMASNAVEMRDRGVVLAGCVVEGFGSYFPPACVSEHPKMPSFSCSLPLSKIDESIGEKKLAQPWKESTPAGRLPTLPAYLHYVPAQSSSLTPTIPLSVREQG